MTPKLEFLRPNYLDASALVKLVINEEYSNRIKNYIFDPKNSWRVCTSYCFAEAINVLKRKKNEAILSERGYVAGCRKLIRLVRDERIRILEGQFSSLTAFTEAERIVKAYKVDFLDAFQLVSIKGSWEHLAYPSQPILVTADGILAKVAGKEGVKFWYCRETHQPTC